MAKESPQHHYSTFPNRPGSEKAAMDTAERFVRSLLPDLSRLEDIRLIVSEACLNAMEHGNCFDTGKTFSLEMVYRQHQLVIRVFDQGGKGNWRGVPPFRSISAAMEGTGETRGWGLQLIDHLADAWMFDVQDVQTVLEIKLHA